jgi:DNA modification methylase
MQYQQFIEQKSLRALPVGFDIDLCNLHQSLFDYQQVVVQWALRRGRAAIFGDTGNGKTPMGAEWAQRVAMHTDGQVLIVAPLAVAQQTIELSQELLSIDIGYARAMADVKHPITITNYEMLGKFDLEEFAGIELDESSILKSQTGAMRNEIIEASQVCPFRLAMTATPSPNDHMELGNHAEYLGVMKMAEMLSMFFTHDGGETQSWVLKGHGKKAFWEWVASWAMCFRNPADLGFDGSRHILPKLNLHPVVVPSDATDQLFPTVVAGLQGRNEARRESLHKRVQEAARIANSFDEPVLTWCLLNEENDLLESAIAGAVSIQGADSIDHKEKTIHDFALGKLEKLISKPSITGYGLNFQHCRKTVFSAINDSFESLYQAIKRFHRFGQTQEVDAWIIYSEAEGAVYENVLRKWAQHEKMQAEMVCYMKDAMQKEIKMAQTEKTEYSRELVKGEGYELHQADCVDLASEIAADSVDYTIFSPPFASLYTYSNSDRDMGNCRTHSEFYQHFRFLVDQMLRITKPGRLLSFHCMNLPTSKVNDGYIGIRDFRGELIRMFEEAGWIYHSEVVIWKDPVTAMQRTKALGLLHKTIRNDSAMSRQGIPDYLVTMRKPGENPKPIRHTHEEFPVHQWQRYASPVWMDINPSDTLNFREAREEDDIRHIAPLQLQVIERAIDLWTAKDDLVFTPFLGIGSEVYTAVRMGRRGIGSELKPAYFRQAIKNVAIAKARNHDLFADSDDQDCA